MSGENGQAGLRVESDRLTALADDLEAMQAHLDAQVKRMDAVVDGIEAAWRGPAAEAYRALHRGVAEDAVRIRMVIQRLEQAVRLSRDGFSEQELDVMDRLRKIQIETDVQAEAAELSTPNPVADAAPSRIISAFGVRG
ncbi:MULTISPECIES: WXG100 family type VII secretion target [unclassified Streptomyces]|uniref:WXG100 family type VII secretion target n=1 Tax=unclassified Streptomyces TaxID=2593676 RepID=UPI000DAEF968|nr:MULTISPECIES: WXG100 family type VII secretion target [unclassified Streptomyces]PZT72319.1 WXG100 family type VII secretion target [Streptomyces sp. AC1-42T]PZT81358.1 WXG100 family type VII secretion target [Streptomyces sp. AC1-42W]